MNFIVSASTDIGNVKKTNQDSLNVKTLTVSGEKVVFAIICDGMGGLERGEVASASVVKAFSKWAVERLPYMVEDSFPAEAICREWSDLITRYNTKIGDYGKKSGISLGTTVTVIILTGTNYCIGQVGDGRAYEITDRAFILTKDQTLVAKEVDQGLLTPEEALEDPRRSVLLQCVGASENVYPEFVLGQTKQNAVYMLCSDGFRHEISGEEIAAYFHPDRMINADAMHANEQMLIEMNKQRQERDNISVITIRTF